MTKKAIRGGLTKYHRVFSIGILFSSVTGSVFG